MSANEYSEAKKRLANKFYFGHVIIFLIALLLFLGFVLPAIPEWREGDFNVYHFLFCITLFLVSCFLLAIIIIGASKLKNDNIKVIKGTVIDFKEWGHDGGIINTPIVKTENGKIIKISGADRDEDGIELGQKYTFLQMFGVAVPVISQKEKTLS